MNNTSIPPRNTRNKIYENQNLLVINPDSIDTKIVWISKVNPIANGCLIFMKIKLKINKKVIKIHWIISRNSLKKNINFGD